MTFISRVINAVQAIGTDIKNLRYKDLMLGFDNLTMDIQWGNNGNNIPVTLTRIDGTGLVKVHLLYVKFSNIGLMQDGRVVLTTLHVERYRKSGIKSAVHNNKRLAGYKTIETQHLGDRVISFVLNPSHLTHLVDVVPEGWFRAANTSHYPKPLGEPNNVTHTSSGVSKVGYVDLRFYLSVKFQSGATHKTGELGRIRMIASKPNTGQRTIAYSYK